MCASKPLHALAPLLLVLACTGAVMAQPSGSREQEQLRRLRSQLQQVQQQQASDAEALRRAQAEKAAAKASVDSAQAELKRLRGSASAQARAAAEAQKATDALQAERQALQARADGLQTELEASRAATEKLRTELGALQRTLVQAQTAMADLNGRHATQAQGLQSCIANNQSLHALGLELLQRYASKDLSEVLAHNEPFLQTRRVALENLVLGYQDKLDALALKPQAGSPAEAQRAP